MKKSIGAALFVAALTLTSACGGGSDRASADDVSAQIKKAAGDAVTQKQADCAAKAIVDSDLSDEAIQAVVDGDTDYKPSKADTKAQADITTEIGKCVTPATPSTPAPSATTAP